jgi:hypothetical protein
MVSECGGKKFGAGNGSSAHFLFTFRQSFSVTHAAGDRRIGIDAAVAQKGPVAANVFQLM